LLVHGLARDGGQGTWLECREACGDEVSGRWRHSGRHPGISGAQPIAWCSIAPRESYRPLGGPEGGHSRVWSLACFFIRREHRRHGLAGPLLRAAIDFAARGGATIVEAYPVDPDSPSYRYMGFVELFQKAGFEEVGRAGARRHVMRLNLAG
jgi:GNAT superfamily N-acetyltransferase